ncbi:MAG: type II toxin-antitoxin system RelE/ParE family toxin [Polaromonas sp.]|uniref:type II toxin-antitoxin system RelE/ParE family toxin n=1 Tax=Polaromonas sp. TaxID=1869339 RepID=UPI00272FEA39|nr:type II toxin-antitoxin system RelE/ParE family toxin [Polaromonas sp.]MDP2450589.1 type II toxin-antitoxin system RelE/ParE family toxin [Polaromonas sp.]MDP3247120.1 type II toxin-antitoxin system RelE/ParE family toxin [Polaromonas sp.]MDP3755759.1 type II toxin-antitoxin system RelE/ParE family toxin [Polaromonas sp.]MDP3828966.1 type II toxin-antitoxin system RelE/ParE family toxin [Polaromonas sp.]
MTYTVLFSEAAAADLEQLFDFALQRELDSETGDLDIPDRAVQAIKDGMAFLASSPFACRKAGSSSFIRELIIPFGRTGYVALFEIVDSQTIIIGALRHQREDDYH